MKWMFLFLLPTMALAKIKTERVIYEKNGVKMEGVLAYDDKTKSPRPGIVIFHEWMGNGTYTESRAKQLAELGYVAFAADVYGQGVRAKDVKEAMELSSKYKNDRKLMRERAQAAMETLSNHKLVNKKEIVAIGYCFGGTVALELARDQAPLQGVVAFHAGLSTPMKSATMKPKVLVLHGGDDPYVPKEEVLGFEQEMREAKADWQLISFGNTVHSFTVKAAGDDPSKGAAYNKLSDERSWKYFTNFLEEIL